MESLEVLDGLVDEPRAARAASPVLSRLGHMAMNRGDPAEAESRFIEALERQRVLGHAPGSSHAFASRPRIALGQVARSRGDLDAARDHFRAGLIQARRFGYAQGVAQALGGIAVLRNRIW